jgi:hypothetical protein
MYNVTVAPALFKNQHWAFPVVHEAAAALFQGFANPLAQAVPVAAGSGGDFQFYPVATAATAQADLGGIWDIHISA